MSTTFISNVATSTSIRNCTLAVDDVPLIWQGHDLPDEDTSEAVFGTPHQAESSITSLGNCIFTVELSSSIYTHVHHHITVLIIIMALYCNRYIATL